MAPVLPKGGGFSKTNFAVLMCPLLQCENVTSIACVAPSLSAEDTHTNIPPSLPLSQRVMASGFFVLLRFFLRVDGVLVRMNDTRFYHQAGFSPTVWLY